MRVNPKRVLTSTDNPETGSPIVYWMSRDQRAEDNWALLHAQDLAIARKVPLVVVFCLVPDFMGAALRQYDFMIRGLSETSISLEKKSIPFFLRIGDPAAQIPPFVQKLGAGCLVTDFDPLRIKRKWKKKISARLKIPLIEVDAHNIVPCRMASPKQEWGAYTIRPRIRKLLSEFLEPFPKFIKHPYPLSNGSEAIDWNRLLKNLQTDNSVAPVQSIESGAGAAKRKLRRFIQTGLDDYNTRRNDPMAEGQSGLSPYLHFGQLSPQRAALDVLGAEVDPIKKEAFLEELIVRRELADNFCFYNPDYDSTRSFPAWARTSLDAHRSDLREETYTPEQFDGAQTHDPLWNAAQMEMVKTGKMHGYMRMYWAKKILEWSENPEQAMERAIRLNDRYNLDGRDPNGYAGIAWSIGGVHDRAWGERQVFGKVRYMSYGGCKSKFDVEGYIRKIEELK
jgi:deoxyribodipyrimidine photo-lyase